MNEMPIEMPSEEEIQAAIKKDAELRRKAQSLTEEERFYLCDAGYYNDTIRGYLILAMKEAGFNRADIQKALSGLHWVMDITSAQEAAQVQYQSHQSVFHNQEIQMPDPMDTDPHPRLRVNGYGIHAGDCFFVLMPDGQWYDVTLEVDWNTTGTACWHISNPAFRDVSPVGLFAKYR